MRKLILLAIAAFSIIALAACSNDTTEQDYSQNPTCQTQAAQIPATALVPSTEPSLELRTVLLEQSGISQYGWQVAADFLSGFTSLFAGVFRVETTWDNEKRIAAPTGYFWRWDSVNQRSVTTDEQPEISFLSTNGGQREGFFDRYGNRIYDAPWAYIQLFDGFYDHQGEPVIFYSHHYANYFSLFDFDNDGIPDIIIHFRQTFDGCYGGFYRIFRYIDGEYRMLKMAAFTDNGEQLSWTNFGTNHLLFADANGRIITFIDSELGGMEYSHLVFTNNRADFYRIPFADHSWEEWKEHHWQVWEQTPYGRELKDSWVLHNPTIFGTDISITPLHPFADLGVELYTYLQHRRQ